MKKPVLVFGLIAGGIISAFMATSMAIVGCSAGTTDYGTSMLVGYASMLIAFSFIFVGIKSYRDKQLDGTITFGKGFKAGILIALIASTMYVITWAIEYNFFMPDFMDSYGKHMVDQAVSEGKPATEIAQITKEMADAKEMYKNPVIFVLMTYAEILPLGIIVTLISAAILRRKPKAQDPVTA